MKKCKKNARSKTVLVRVPRSKVVIGPGGVVKIRVPRRRRAKPNPPRRRKPVARTNRRRTIARKPRRAATNRRNPYAPDTWQIEYRKSPGDWRIAGQAEGRTAVAAIRNFKKEGWAAAEFRGVKLRARRLA